MADITALKNRIRAAIKANDNQEITGPVLQQALLDIVDELSGATETEAGARQNGDRTLQQGINTERQARIDADNALGQRINSINASNVTYNHNNSQLDATNVQQAVDEISTKTVFDISAYHATGGTLATYDNLEDALGTNGKNIPQSLKKGGMSVKFVQSSDNKYVQYRLMSQSFSTTESDWQNIGLVQQAGQSKTVAMSQKAVTDELNKIDSKTAIVVDDDSVAELNIGDQQGNVIAQFKKGHIKTKEFDSSKAIKSISDDSVAELNIGDQQGNVIAQFKKGHIKTKEFDSSKVGYSPYIKFQGKRFAVIGDSISSYRGITKSGYATFYPKGDVISSTQTWWGILRDTLGMSCVNRAWSGSQCTGNSAASATAWAACSTQRILDIGDDGAPDIVLCYIGTNDWQDSQRDQGNWTYNDAVPEDGVITEFKPAYAMMLHKIQTYYPNARIFCCTIIEDKARDKTAGWPANNSRGISLCAFNESIKYVADAFGADIIDLHNCGLTYNNIASFAVDGGLHPNAAGHALMANKIIQDLISKY